MNNYGEKINTFINKLSLDKKIKIRIDNKSKIQRFYLEIDGHKEIRELSDGEKQKVALAIFFYYILEKTYEYSKEILVIGPYC